jgi:hypothetical protein
MFICNQCLKKKFTNNESMFKSRGSCEICNKVDVCNEIKSSYLVPRNLKKEHRQEYEIKYREKHKVVK